MNHTKERVKTFREGQIVSPEKSYLVDHDAEIVNLTSYPLAIALRTGHRAVQLKDQLGKKSLNIIEIYDDPNRVEESTDDGRLITDEYRAMFTPESVKRAEKYADLFQYSCHFLNDEEILEVINIIAMKVKKSIESTWDQFDRIMEEI